MRAHHFQIHLRNGEMLRREYKQLSLARTMAEGMDARIAAMTRDGKIIRHYEVNPR
jgi:hypothetical protein